MSAINIDSFYQLGNALIKAQKNNPNVSQKVELESFKKWIITTDWFRNNSQEISKELLVAMKDYSKGSSTQRFFSGNWNSTFGEKIDKLLEKIGDRTPDLPMLIGELSEINVQGKNPFDSKGSFKIVKNKYNKLIDDLAGKILNGTSMATVDWQLCKNDAINEYLMNGPSDPTKYESFGMGKY